MGWRRYFNIIDSGNTAVITDLGTGGSDTLVSDSAKGVVATIKEYQRLRLLAIEKVLLMLYLMRVMV